MFSRIDARTGLGVALALWAMGSGVAAAAVPVGQDLTEVLEDGSTAHKLKALRGAVHALEGPQKTQLDRLLQDHRRGEIGLDELERRSLELGLGSRTVLDDTVLREPRNLQDVDLAGARFEGADLAVRPDQLGRFQARVMEVSDDVVFVDLTTYLDEGGDPAKAWIRSGLRKDGAPVPLVLEEGGFELEVGQTAVLRGSTHVQVGAEPKVLCTLLTVLERNGTLVLEALDVQGSLRNAPMQWSEGQQAYWGEFLLGLSFPAVEGGEVDPRRDRVISLRDPRTALTGARGGKASATPDEVRFEKVNTLETTAFLAAEEHDAEGLALKVILEDETFHLEPEILPVTTSLSVTPKTRRIWGFGLGSTTLTFRRHAEDGREHAAEHPLQLSVQLEGGSPRIVDPTIPAGSASSGPVVLRTESVGPVILTASANTLTTEGLELVQVWPWELILACLLAGALGAAVRLAPGARSGSGEEDGDDGGGASDPPAPITRWAVALPVGALVGLVLVMALLTGLVQLDQVPAAQVTTLAGAFVVALIGGYLGRKVLDRMAQAT